jgi:hypothetical protein
MNSYLAEDIGSGPVVGGNAEVRDTHEKTSCGDASEDQNHEDVRSHGHNQEE